MRLLDLNELQQDLPGITKTWAACYEEAAIVAFEKNKHSSGVQLARLRHRGRIWQTKIKIRIEMNLSRALHQTAMEYSTFAKVAKAQGRDDMAEEFYKRAFLSERDAAANASPFETDPVPRFILLRSAAALALKAGRLAEARQLIVATLAENPPEFIVHELKEIEASVEQASLAAKKPLRIRGRLTDIQETDLEIEVEEAGSHHRYVLLVPTGKLKEIVQRYFSEVVQIKAVSNPQGVFTLESISKAA